MPTRINLRPILELPNLENMTSIESFQNQTLRPILKLQNDIFISMFKNYVLRQKVDFNQLTKEKRKDFINQSIQKDIAFKNTLIGITIGMFTNKEFEVYFAESKEFNRRIITMLIERITSQLL